VIPAEPPFSHDSFAPDPAPVRRRARLGAALALSMVFHLWLLDAITVHVPGRTSSKIPVQITASLEPLDTFAVVQAPRRRESQSVDDPTPHQPRGRNVPHRNDAGVAAASVVSRSISPPAKGKGGALPPQRAAQVKGATYYPADELDVYPMLIQSISVGHFMHAAAESARGEVLLQLLIDAAGVVKEASIIRAEPAGGWEKGVRSLMSSARFVPGRKDGREVATRILINIQYDADRDHGVSP